MEQSRIFQKFTINTSDICIYCEKKLSEQEKGGEGEHIFPKNIKGFLKSWDVCNECIKYFGDNLDGLTIKNSQIFKAQKELKYNVKNFYPGVKFVGIDKHSREEKDYLHYKGKFQIRKSSSTTGDFIELPEYQLEKNGKTWLRKNLSILDKISQKIFDEEFDRIRNEYSKLKPDEEIRSDVFNAVFRKRGIEKVVTKEDLIYNIQPLVSKIVVFFLYMIFGIYFKNSYSNVNEFVRNCMKCEKFSTHYFLGPLQTDLKVTRYLKFHEICFTNLKHDGIIDVVFFGNIIWRAFLQASNEDIVNKLAEFYEFKIILDFEFDNDRKILLGFKEKEKDELKYLEYNCHDSF